MQFSSKELSNFLGVDINTLNKQISRGGAGEKFTKIGTGRALQFDEAEAAGVFAMHIAMKHVFRTDIAKIYALDVTKIARLPEAEMKRWALVFWLWKSAKHGKQESAQLYQAPEGQTASKKMDYSRGNSFCTYYPIWIFTSLVEDLKKEVMKARKEKKKTATKKETAAAA